ncbi:MAG TPA: MBL fold metallo-hydrolase, partial [Dehalococcoidia bacterium]|nr:MBL fold metallo-hydrolase [Dehalococcoidia bacterium]
MTDTVFDEAAGVFARQISTFDLGDHSYVVVVGDRAAVIDPQRDVERFDDALSETGARLVAVFETHMHNDYVAGGRILADRHGATCYVLAGSEATFEHEAPSDGDRVAIGEWQLAAMLTPGHTPTHTSYCLLSPAGEAVAVFSGGSMLVDAIGRSDLLGPDLAGGLARQQFHSGHRLVGELPDAASGQPTHGAGSFCAITTTGDGTRSTIERERLQNPVLTAADEDSFVQEQLAGATLFPAYYARMAPLNRAGPGPIVDAPLPRLSPDELAAVDDATWVVDVRISLLVGAGHFPGSTNVPASDDLDAYVGWIVPWGASIVLVTSDDAELAQAASYWGASVSTRSLPRS